MSLFGSFFNKKEEAITASQSARRPAARRPEAQTNTRSGGASVVKLRAVPSASGSAQIRSGGTEIVCLQSVADLPHMKSVLTVAGAAYELPETQRPRCVAFETDHRKIWILADAEFMRSPSTKMHVASLRERMRKAELIVEKTAVGTSELIKSINNQARHLKDSQNGEQENTEERQFFHMLVKVGLQNRATDIHAEVREKQALIRYRVDGELETMRNDVRGVYISNEVSDALGYAYNKLSSERTNSSSAFNPLESQSCMIPYSLGSRKMNLRYQSTPVHGGYDVIIRYLFDDEKAMKVSKFEDLGYSGDQAAMLDVAARTRTGMVMIAGITGSGKSTTLKTVIQNIPGRAGLKIFTVEDPVEFSIEGVSQISVQRNLKDTKVKTPYDEIQAVLMRCDPDTIMQGEIRDRPTGEAAQVFIETGHQVMATVHANSVLGVFPRLLARSIGFSLETLTTVQFWSLIIYQALVPKLCPNCKIPADKVIFGKVAYIRDKFDISTDNMFCRNEDGCPECDHRGTKGQTVVAEMVQPTRLLLKHLRERDEYEAEKAWRNNSDRKFDTPHMTGKTVFEHALYKAFLGEVDPRVVERFETFERYEKI